MASCNRDTDRNVGMLDHGDALHHAAIPRRPILPRASATEPSITAPNAIRGSLVSPRTPERATDLLSKVAFCMQTPRTIGRMTPNFWRHHLEIVTNRGHQATSASTHEVQEMLCESPSGRYFSFPSIENWAGSEEESGGVFG